MVVHPVHPERWGACLRQQRNAYFDALLFKKHRQLYRDRIRRQPPWRYYAIVALTLSVYWRMRGALRFRVLFL